MLFHLSLSAHDPQNVARVLAQLAGGTAFVFPPLTDDGWVVIVDDGLGTAIEVLPFGTVLRETEDGCDVIGVPGGLDELTATHAAIGTQLDIAGVMEIARRVGWSAKHRRRGGAFGVIEIWIEGRQMIELLTPDMQREYLARYNPRAWQTYLASRGSPGTGEV